MLGVARPDRDLYREGQRSRDVKRGLETVVVRLAVQEPVFTMLLVEAEL